MDTVLRLRVNGQERELVSSASGSTVLDLLASLDQHPKTVAVELNRELVPRARFGETALRDGDRVEIVRFVQGGSVAGDQPGAVEAAHLVRGGWRRSVPV